MRKLFILIFLSLTAFLPAGAYGAVGSEWVVWFTTSSYAIFSSTDVVWDNHVRLGTETVKVLGSEGFYKTPSGEWTGSGDYEFGYLFQSKINGWISRLYRYAEINSTDNVTMNFWDQFNFLIASATITDYSTGWVHVDSGSFNPPGLIEIDQGYDYRVSVIISTTTEAYTKCASPANDFPNNVLKDEGDDIIEFLNNVYTTPPGCPITDLPIQELYGIPDMELLFYGGGGDIESIVYDTQTSTPKYKSYTSSATIPGTGSPQASISWKFGVSSSPSGPFDFITMPNSDLTSLENYRYIKFRAHLEPNQYRDTPILYGVTVDYNIAPSSFTLIYPPAGAIIGNNSPEFEWKPSYDLDGDTVTYTLEISTNSVFEPPLVSSSGITSTSIQYSVLSSTPLADLTTYYWRMRATDTQSDSSYWTAPASFIVDFLSDFRIFSSVPENGGMLFASSLLGVNKDFYRINVVFNKEVDIITINSSSFRIENENSEKLDFNYDIWINSVTISVSTSTVPTIEDSLMYTVTVSSSIKVYKVNKYLYPPYEIEFATLLSTKTISFFSEYIYEITIPPGAVDESFYVQRKEIQENTDQDLKQANIYAEINSLLKPITTDAYSFNITDKDNDSVETFNEQVTLRFSYAGMVVNEDYVYDISDPSNLIIKTESLKIFRVGGSKNWELVQNQVQDKPNKTITAYLTNFSIYSILAYSTAKDVLSGVKNMPNPFSAGTEDTTVYYILTVDSNVTIKIYNLIGDMVKEFGSDECPGIGGSGGNLNYKQWDGRNGIGRVVADGCYICCIIAEYEDENGETGTMQKLHKIAVMK